MNAAFGVSRTRAIDSDGRRSSRRLIAWPCAEIAKRTVSDNSDKYFLHDIIVAVFVRVERTAKGSTGRDQIVFSRAAILASVSLCSVLVAVSAHAQTTQGNTPDGIGAPIGTPVDAAEQASPGTPARSDTADDEADIVVTGVRASILGALNVKRNATQVVDSIVAEDVGKLPDNNVIEALQRVSGIQVTNRTGGEAAGISIRGLPDALTTMNGRNIFTASGQAFALQDIPANLVKRIDVYKTRAADQIETGIAGQIDVFTRRPFDFKGFAISGVARGIYNEQADLV
ncbi:TonB-dependent receptor plug domain-containing protein [Sphingomonas panni]